MKINKIIIAALAFLTFSSGARGQLIWHITHTDQDSHYQYGFTSLSCAGNNCTAASILYDKLNKTDYLKFWRSTDGGVSWNMEDFVYYAGTGGHNNWLSRIQQIDSLNIIAIGAYGLILRTFDGGKTWEKQDCRSTAIKLSEVHFSDPLTGILTAETSDSLGAIYTTTDGGRHWNNITIPIFEKYGFSQCHSFGNGRFSILAKGIGPIYSTVDNWKTIDSSKKLIDAASDSTWFDYYFTKCNFAGQDTIIAYGGYSFGATYGIIMRSVDGGKLWEKPFTHDNTPTVTHMTSLNRDTVFAGSYGIAGLFMSADKGSTWRWDAFILNDSSNFAAESCNSLDWAGSSLVASYAVDPFYSSPALLVRGEFVRSKVESSGSVEHYLWITLNKNPVTDQLSCKLYWFNSDAVKPSLKIYDMLGRPVQDISPEVQKASTSWGAEITANISSLPNGVYLLVMDAGGYLKSERFVVTK